MPAAVRCGLFGDSSAVAAAMRLPRFRFGHLIDFVGGVCLYSEVGILDVRSVDTNETAVSHSGIRAAKLLTPGKNSLEAEMRSADANERASPQDGDPADPESSQ